ncbi:nuclear transport factor 2 family protein [Streptococcus sp. CSL10205-OR2]|uniref:nuclear transport factor 2 family protein n=1 Tax=Streptococcus sp. CSL10205-OR2 TaxID=2980558 RepID=UPI0021DAA15A|nr:nuclear transport factor 2 family protein [Streptococcus sp. CSL10205-OR2]MCU9533088.1 nuclear transport factor 2 family protein [Streptococcus sp. CSL10205-OR2]
MTLEDNKKNAIAFYQTAYEGNPREAVSKYVGDDYKQHNPLVGDGKEAFIAYFEKMNEDYPNKTISFVRAIAEGDLVSLHTHQVWHYTKEEAHEFVTMDFFRFDPHGKIIEHWDAIQEIPEGSMNGNTMY